MRNKYLCILKRNIKKCDFQNKKLRDSTMKKNHRHNNNKLKVNNNHSEPRSGNILTTLRIMTPPARVVRWFPPQTTVKVATNVCAIFAGLDAIATLFIIGFQNTRCRCYFKYKNNIILSVTHDDTWTSSLLRNKII